MRLTDGTLNAKYDHIRGAEVSFRTRDVGELERIINKYKDKPLQVKIEPIRQKRSLDANGYMWVLCDKIADAIKSTRTEVYKQAIREVGVWQDVAIQRKDLAGWISAWESMGIGYQVEVHDSKIKDCNRVRMYLGSSKYDTKQMSRLIDYIVDEAKELDIETLTPDEIAQMKQQWGT